MKIALNKLLELKSMLSNFPELKKDPQFKEFRSILGHAIDDLIFSVPFCLHYRDDGPSGFSVQCMSVTCEWDKLILLPKELDAGEQNELLKKIGAGRKNPRFENSWVNSSGQITNNVIDLRDVESDSPFDG